MEFEIEDILKNGNGIFNSKDSPSFMPLSPPRFVDDSQPASPTFKIPYDSGYENPYMVLMGEATSTKLRPTIVLKELPRVEKKNSLGVSQ